MNTAAAAADLSHYTKYREAYLRAFDRMLKVNEEKGLKSKCDWKMAEDVYRWWLKQTD